MKLLNHWGVRRFANGAGLLAAVLCVFATSALAQAPPTSSRPERPYRGLFGGGVGETEQLLAFTGLFAGGYDDDVLGAEAGGGLSRDPRTLQPGSYAQIAGTLTYSLNRRRVSLSTFGQSSLRIYSSDRVGNLASHSAGVSLSAQLAKNTTFNGSQSISLEPFYLFAFEPIATSVEAPVVEVQNPSFDVSSKVQRALSAASSLSLSQTLSKRTSVSAEYRFHTYTLGEQPVDDRLLGDQPPGGAQLLGADQVEYRSQAGGLRFTHGLTRNASLHLGYVYEGTRYGADQRLAERHNVDAGVNYHRALSFSRRTTLSFGTGSVILRDRDRTDARINGNATLNREIGRTWNLGLTYARDVGFVQTFAEPIQSDTLTLQTSGSANRRVRLNAGASYARGAVGLHASDNGFTTYNANAGASVALTRYLALGTQYFYYDYVFDRSALLLPGLEREFRRQGVRAVLTTWLPLLQRARRPDAAR